MANNTQRDELHKTIWAIADSLRGAVGGWEFKAYVLGAIFYRYISENITRHINQLQAEADEYYKGLMIDEGVTVVEPTEEVLAGFREKAKAFYDLGSTFGWSDGLYDTVCAAMGK